MVHPSPLPSCPFTVRALYPFQAENSAELSLTKGDLIQVCATDDAGWWEGTCQNKKGLFPANYVEIHNQQSSSLNNSNKPHINVDDLNSPTSNLSSPASALSIAASTITSRTNSIHHQNNNQNGNHTISPQQQSTTSSYSSSYHKDHALVDCSQLAIESQQQTYFKPPTSHLPGHRTITSQRERNAALRKTVARAPTQFGQWAWNMALISACAAIVFGIAAIVWYINDDVCCCDSIVS
jgi:hypothetical protein